MEELTVMERFCDPALFDSLTTAELWQGGLLTTLMGMGTTFIVLAAIWLSIAIMGRVLHFVDNRKVKTGEALSPATCPETPAAVASSPIAAEAGISPEVIAVITAAINAMNDAGTSDNLIIRKINRMSGNRPVWGSAGTTDSIESRKF